MEEIGMVEPTKESEVEYTLHKQRSNRNSHASAIKCTGLNLPNKKHTTKAVVVWVTMPENNLVYGVN
jgi:hypothetical protein